MANVRKVLKEISRTRRVEREFASNAERKVVTKPFEARQDIKFQDLP